MKTKLSPIPIKNQILQLLDKLIEDGNVHIWENWESLWKTYRVVCDSEKQKACLLYLQIAPDDNLAAEIQRKATLFAKNGSYSDGYWPHLRRWLHNAEWEDVPDHWE